MPRRLTPAAAGIALIWLIAAAGTLFAQQNASHEWSTRVWVADGLSDRAISGVAQTPDGFLWVANRIGLARFDGAHFTEFPIRVLGGANHDRIRVLERSRAGGLWLLTDTTRAEEVPPSRQGSRLIHLNGGAPVVRTEGLPNLTAESLTEDNAGDVWITYHGGTVVCVRNNEVVDFTNRAGLTGAPCTLTRDNEGRIWFAQRGAIGMFRHDRFETQVTLRDVSTRILGARSGGIWICSGHQLLRFGPDGKLVELSREIAPGAMLEDREGALWVGSATEGLFRYSADGLARIPTSSAAITSLIQDDEGNIWVGTRSGGLNRIRPKSVVVEGSTTGLAPQAIRSLCEDPNGRLWGIASNGLVLQREGSGWEQAGLAGNGVNRFTCIAADDAGRLWAGTAFGSSTQRLCAWENGQLHTWGEAEGLTSTSVNQLVATHSGVVWMAASNPATIARVRDGRLTVLPLPPRDSATGITAVTEDADGAIWFGTARGELLRITGERVENVSALAPVQKRIHTLKVTKDGSLWIGYSTVGLGRLKDGKFSLIGPDRGLAVGGVTHIVPDARGGLWLAGDHGVFWARVEDLAAVADHKVDRLQPIQVRDAAGRTDLTAFAAETGAELRSRDGRVWLGLGPALLIIDPGRFDHPAVSPGTLLTRVLVDGKAVAAYRGILPPEATAPAAVSLVPDARLRAPVSAAHQKIEFEFTTLSLSGPEDVAFKYRLLGYDENWSDPGPERHATFHRLPAGPYRFEAVGCDSSGRWNDRPAGVTLEVATFFWKTWWWEAAVLAVFAGLVYLAARAFTHRRLRRRMQKLRQEAALADERARIARDIHDDIGNRLTQIILLSGLGRRHRGNAAQAEEHFIEIGAATTEVTKSLDEIVWAVNPRNDTLGHVLGYLAKFAVDFLRSAQVRCEVVRPDPTPDQPVPADVRHNLFLAVKEALSNIVRHAAATEVRISFALARRVLTVAIEDNGRGLAVGGDDPDADGLRNMRHRMEEIGGRFEAGANPRGGTRIVLAVPLPRAK